MLVFMYIVIPSGVTHNDNTFYSILFLFVVLRLKMKPDVVLRRLAIAVASNDHSYMPQLVSVSVGKNRRSLQEIRDIRIPSNVTGYVALLENANISHPCESDSLHKPVWAGLV